ncbi:hypothetical protein C453_05249 [Haloferax elongans ATCC BAA-1513]|uniref:Flagellin-like protein n=1 Tax=Haloferax elongans ATCC BAA-1513 TaxID=1230453 RepID=M0HVE7_HALEO|nr:hypothetical protein [Haloferax elongans]ELZ87733.1 hypothetical protein C453_05249 [Haloferax elongans ATCC BAA-1513]
MTGPTSRTRTASSRSETRAQSNVVGVALLLGIGVVAIGLVTASVGGLVDAQRTSADAGAAADGFESLRDGTFASEDGAYPMRVTDGNLVRVNRTVRVIADSGVNRTYDADGYVATIGSHRVAFVGGAVVRGTGENAQLVTPVPLSSAGDAAFLPLPVLNASSSDGGGLDAGTELQTQTTRTVSERPVDTYTVAVETAAPTAWERAYERRGFDTTRSDFDGDGVPSVVVTLPADQTLTVVQYDLTVEVRRG